jgi:ring-1,2-phenylacetyl-CoA epoxidase subunit PaaC
MNKEAIKEMIFKMADDALIIGHRNSEWTGLGPILEEDIAFSSMAQDKVGHALQLYTILHEEFGEADPDTLAFTRPASEFKCCQLTELPIGAYDFSLVRQFLFDRAEFIRYESLTRSKFEPLAALAGKVLGEIKYHVMHGDTWMIKLGEGTEESKARMQSALNEAFPYALAIFEEGPNESDLISDGVWEGEVSAKDRWIESLLPILEQARLTLPSETTAPISGGRAGEHTEHLQPLLTEMGEVVAFDPEAKSW